jgi:hypothetical protein
VGREPNTRFRFNEGMVLLGALGILISVAVPSYLQVRNADRMETLLTEAIQFREELSRWIERPERFPSLAVGKITESMKGAVSPDLSSAVSPETLRDFLRLYNLTGELPAAEEARIVLEPSGLPAERCARDGKIHVIPLEPEAGSVSGATILVTNRVHSGGPRDDGLLAEYRVRTSR